MRLNHKFILSDKIICPNKINFKNWEIMKRKWVSLKFRHN